MAITITTPADTKRLCELSTLKADLGITGGDDDTALELKIDQASAAIVAYCEREFARETVKETLAGFGEFNLMLKRTPIISIASILYDAVTVDATDYVVNEPDVGLVYNKFRWRDTARGLVGIGRIPENNSREYLYEANYTAGYLLPSETGRDLPFDIEAACLQLSSMLWKGRNRDQSIESEAVSGVYSVKYSASTLLTGHFPPAINSLLEKWRRYA